MKDTKSKITISNVFLVIMCACAAMTYVLAVFTNARDIAVGFACASLIACVMTSATRKD